MLLIESILSAQIEDLSVDKETTIVDLKVMPSATDATIKTTDVAHWVRYDAAIPADKLFLFLPGTNGVPVKGPRKLFETAIQEGHKVINLSYINQPAVARICRGENLENDESCAKNFRTQRVFGTQLTTLIPDESQDAIIPRLTKLLTYLIKYDKEGDWEKFMENDTPKWSEIIVTGQSQGGGMAAFIAKQKLVYRIVTFSGGWDYSAKNKIANWYSDKSVTPLDRWFGTYHVEEPMASTIDATYKEMGIPAQHIYSLDKEVPSNRKAHSQAIRNIGYKDLWIALLQTTN